MCRLFQGGEQFAYFPNLLVLLIRVNEDQTPWQIVLQVERAMKSSY